MINAEVRSEEMFVRLSIAFNTDEEKKCVVNTVDAILKKHKLDKDADIHFTSSSDKTIMVIEFHEDRNREPGEVFEEIIKTLNVECII